MASVEALLLGGGALMPLWRAILWAFVIYLAALGGTAIVCPERARRFLARFAANWVNNLVEAVLRGLVGLSFIAAASTTREPNASSAVGILLVVTAILMALLPRAHARFAPAATKLVFGMLPWFGVLSLALAALVAWFIF